MREFIAVDAGGTSTRAVVVDQHGRCLGVGRAGGGNPTSRGAVEAGAATVAAIGRAFGANGSPGEIALVLVAHAGERKDEFRAGIEGGLATLGVHAPIVFAGDLTALFTSGTAEPEGVALIAGTGAIAGVIRHGALARVVDGVGWLLGDAGSGFWIGHRVVRAVSASLDGGPTTALTGALLEAVHLPDDRTLSAGRPAVQLRLLETLYALRPIELARFAPLAFTHRDDPVARAILVDAVAALTDLLTRARQEQATGPLVFGGSVLTQGVLALEPDLIAPLLAASGARPVAVPDGLLGAAVLVLRAAGVEVDARRFAVLAASVRGSAPSPAVPGR